MFVAVLSFILIDSWCCCGAHKELILDIMKDTKAVY